MINAFEDPPIVGKWELDLNPDTTLDIEVDGDGDATIISTIGEHRYDVEWTQEDVDEFELEFQCEQTPMGCVDADFKMDCETSSTGNNLDCTARSLWDPPDFEWSKEDEEE